MLRPFVEAEQAENIVWTSFVLSAESNKYIIDIPRLGALLSASRFPNE